MPVLKNSKRTLNHSELRSILIYDEDSGLFRWLEAIGRRVHVGDIAGSPGSHGYIQIQIFGRLYLGHVLAWFWKTGEWPVGEIDHRDLDRSNNRWKNLRTATHAQNCFNQGARRTSKSGIKGLYFDKAVDRWRGSVGANGKRRTISARTQAEAEALLRELQTEMHGSFGRAA